MFRRSTKELVCPRCGNVLATVSRRLWPPALDVCSVDGYELMPSRAGKLVRLAKEQGESGEQVDLLNRNAYELVYEFRCRCGQSEVQLVPQIVKAMRETKGRWVTLG